MEHFFEEQFNRDVFWCNDNTKLHETPVASQSAFVPYTPGTDSSGLSENVKNLCNNKNANQRMMEFMKRSTVATLGSHEPEKMKCQRHVMTERMRREREKQCYLSLHSVLPHRTKNDRKTIVQVAAKTIHQLQCWKRELEKRNYELEAKMGIEDNVKKIRVSIGNPISGIDSILEVLNCLKMLGSTVRSMQSQFSDEKLTAVIDVETQMGAAEVEKAVERTLQEVERKLLFNYQEDN